MFNTKGVRNPESGSVRPYLSYGINHAKINKIEVQKAARSESRRVVFYLEGDPVSDETFVGVEGAKGPVGRMSSNYMSTDKHYKDFLSQISVIADKMGVRAVVDAIEDSTIEGYLAKVSPFICGKFVWWNIGAEEYQKGKFNLRLLKYGFVKSDAEVDVDTLVKDRWINTDLSNKAGVVVLKFDPTNRFHLSKFVEASRDGDGALFASEPSLPSFDSSDDDLPFQSFDSKVDAF